MQGSQPFPTGPDHLPFDLVLEHLCLEAKACFVLVSWKGAILRSSPCFAESGVDTRAPLPAGWISWEVSAGVVWVYLGTDTSKTQAEYIQPLQTLSEGLRTSIHSIAGAAELIARSQPHTDQGPGLETFNHSASDLRRLAEDVLDMSCLSDAHLDTISERLELRRFLLGVVDDYRELASSKGLELRLDESTDLPDLVQVDRTRLFQALDSLIGIGIRCTHEGRVVLAVSRPELGRLRFEVRDSGVGLDTQEQEGALGPGGDSSHLGLAIARRAVASLGGELRIDSLPGVGSMSCFEVPLLLTREAVCTALEEEPPLAGLRILLVEADRASGFVTRCMLEAGGAEVDWLYSGLEGIEEVVQRPYALVIMDLSLPDMSGTEASAAIRGLGGSLARLPMVAFSACYDDQSRAGALVAGMNGCLQKPIRCQDLWAAVARYVFPTAAEVKSGK